ncbi:TPA: DUF1566 domain-containing protein [Vibrio cholerae]|nr:DUF1566 domain-containing protein [Vibrio cholerae]
MDSKPQKLQRRVPVLKNGKISMLFLVSLFANSIVLPVMASVACAGHENVYIESTTPDKDFLDNGDGTITHKSSGLMWQRCAVGEIWDGSICTNGIRAGVFSWKDALGVAKQNEFAGYTDWRLPNISELLSIVERRCWNPAVNNNLFPNSIAYYFTSSSVEQSNALGVDFYKGTMSQSDKSAATGIYVRLVRDALGKPSGEPSIEIIEDVTGDRK